MRKLSFLILFFFILLNSCAKEEKKASVIKETRQDLEMISAYTEKVMML